jgi:hypothetical protein
MQPLRKLLRTQQLTVARDGNADTLAGGFDFLTLQRQLGSGGGVAVAAATTIPEPSSLLLATLGLLTLSARRKHP